MKVKTATSYQIKDILKLLKEQKQKSLTHMAFCTLQMLSSYVIMPKKKEKKNILKIQDIHQCTSIEEDASKNDVKVKTKITH